MKLLLTVCLALLSSTAYADTTATVNAPALNSTTLGVVSAIGYPKDESNGNFPWINTCGYYYSAGTC